MTKTILAATILALPLLAGCTGTHPDAVSPGFGAALNYDLAIQVENPDRHPAEEAAPELDGKVAGDAFERYRAHKVIRPQTTPTTTIFSTTGGGGGAGTGGAAGGG